MALFISEVFADAINQKLGVALKMGQLASDVTNDVADITTQGDKIHFPKYDRVANVGNVTKGVALVPSEISMTDNEADIKNTGGSIRVYDKDSKQIRGKTLDNMAQQLVDAMVQDLDSSLSATMDLEATKSSKIIDKLLANNGFLIIINCGENFITAYMKKYMGSDYYFIESLEDEYENEALEESANLRAIKKIYGSVMKYYIFVKKR